MTKQLNCVSVADLRAKPADFYVIDVRDPEDYTAVHVEGAVNIPLDCLREQAETLPAATIPLTVCGKGGGRSSEGAEILRTLGRADSVWLCGGTNAWASFEV